MQFQLKHLLIATTIIAATLAISPALTVLLGLMLALSLLVNLFVPQRRPPRRHDDNECSNQQFVHPSIGLLICFLLFVFSVGLPIVQELLYLSSDWYPPLWLVPQLLSYIFSMVLLSFVRFDSHDRYEYRVIVTIFYIVFVPVVIVGTFLWDAFVN